MSLEPLPPNLEQGIQQYAAEQHISHDEAVRELLASALGRTAPHKHRESSETDPAVVEAVKKIKKVRNQRAKELKELSVPDESVRKLIGILENEPESVEAIREANRERRRAMYGS
jgi:hypothetical protein